MKFFAGFITSVVIIALTLTGIYAYKELKPVDKEQPQQTEKIEDPATTQQLNQPTEMQEQPQQTDEQPAPVTEEPNGNNDTIKQTSPNKPSVEQSYYLTDDEKNEHDQLQKKKLDAMNGKTTMSPAESERLRNLTARFEAMKRLDKYQ
ncbi:hypothetical protein ACYDLZ_07555 [Staphylococcus succinus]